MTNVSSVVGQSIPFDMVTNEQVKAAYRANKTVSSLYAWDHVKKSELLYLLLKREASLAPLLHPEAQADTSTDADTFAKPESSFKRPKNSYHLGAQQARQIRQAMQMARNILHLENAGDLARKEVLAELYHAQQTFNKLDNRP